MATREKYLQQTSYKDGNGHGINSSAVQVLAAYRHICDGFYDWACGSCVFEHHSRTCGWPIAGQVLKCESCGKMNLLVRTNCIEIDALMRRNMEVEYDKKELERLKDIEKYNEAQVNQIKSQLWNVVQSALSQRLPAPSTKEREAENGS